MTMPPPAHPDPERLAALAGEDADVLADRVLGEHVASCSVCDGQVREMASLRAVLAQMPDLAPSRPLQLVPPVPAPAPSGWRVAFRRAVAPVAVAGMVLLLVGGVGATGVLGPADAQRLLVLPFQQAASAPDPAQPEISGDDGSQTDGGERPASSEAPPAEGTDGNGGAGAFAPTPQPPGAVGGQDSEEEPVSRDEDLDVESTPTSGWVLLMAVGLGLLVVAVGLRVLSPKGARTGR